MAIEPRVYHPTMGFVCLDGDTGTCSRCCHTIPEEHVPLIMWDETGHLMWVYCETCEKPMFKILTRAG